MKPDNNAPTPGDGEVRTKLMAGLAGCLVGYKEAAPHHKDVYEFVERIVMPNIESYVQTQVAAAEMAARIDEAKEALFLMQRYTKYVEKDYFINWLISCKEELLMPQEDRLAELQSKGENQ